VSPIVSSIDEFGEQSQPRLSASPPVPPKPLPAIPQPKKGNVITNVLNKFKKMFMKFEKGEETPRNLSDKLAPERDDEHKGYDALFLKPPKPTISRK
jgi:hypothetical protein